MKVVILAGGYGTRISEESHLRPKPMIEIGGKPILWHIMKLYACQGYDEFIICLGYKGHMIVEYFHHFDLYGSDVTFDYRGGRRRLMHHRSTEPWKVTLVHTGESTMTGGRIKRIRPYIGNETFMLTYGDGVADVDIGEVAAFHIRHGKLATVTAVQPSGRFGSLDISEGGRVKHFREKPHGDGAWVNGGFFVLQPDVFDYIEGDDTTFEKEPLERLAGENQLMACKHDGFWHPMDTMRDKQHLDDMWSRGKAPWKKWDS